MRPVVRIHKENGYLLLSRLLLLFLLVLLLFLLSWFLFLLVLLLLVLLSIFLLILLLVLLGFLLSRALCTRWTLRASLTLRTTAISVLLEFLGIRYKFVSNLRIPS